jgi:hypothetical protein
LSIFLSFYTCHNLISYGPPMFHVLNSSLCH